MKELERWDWVVSDVSGYSIIPFEDGYYYGLYSWVDIPENPRFSSERTGYVSHTRPADNTHWIVGSALASAIGLPEWCQFKTVEECKEFAQKNCSSYSNWISSPA